MSNFNRIAIAAVLVAGFCGIANAEAQSQQSQPAPDSYYALSEGRSGVTDRTADVAGTVAPSESQTVMGLRVPR